MSCQNFTKTNVENYYVVLDTYKDEDGTEYTRDKFEFDEYMDCVLEHLRAGNNEWQPDGTRVPYLDASSIAEKEAWVSPYRKEGSYEMFCISIKTRIVLRSGYYSGANFDYDLEITTHYEGFEYSLSECGDTESLALNVLKAYKDIVHYYGDYYCWNQGTFKLQAKHLKSWLENTFNKYCAEAELACLTSCEKVLVKTDQFSNGEAWYSEVSDEKVGQIKKDLEEQAK